MPKNKLEKYILIRVLILSVILSIIFIVFAEQFWFGLVGIVSGTSAGLLKLSLLVKALPKILSPSSGLKPSTRSILRFGAGYLAVFVLLFIGATINLTLFAGMAAGILLVPFAIFLYGIAKGLGLSKYDFE